MVISCVRASADPAPSYRDNNKAQLVMVDTRVNSPSSTASHPGYYYNQALQQAGDASAVGGIVTDMRNAMVAYQTQTIPELLRSVAIFTTCKQKWLVTNAEQVGATPLSKYWCSRLITLTFSGMLATHLSRLWHVLNGLL